MVQYGLAIIILHLLVIQNIWIFLSASEEIDFSKPQAEVVPH